MATDFSRVRANPLLDYAGVQLKQGAVLLDSDANELVSILDRRLRACLAGIRAEMPAPGAPELQDLALFLAWRAGGLPIEAPGVRR